MIGAVAVNVLPAWIIAGSTLATLALCVWSIPHHRKHR